MQFTRMMDVLDAYLEDRGHQVARIDGTMSYEKRMGHIDNFNDNADCFAFLLSTRAGGLGLNLTSADTVIIYDSDWNPHQDMQVRAAPRLWRTVQLVPRFASGTPLRGGCCGARTALPVVFGCPVAMGLPGCVLCHACVCLRQI